MSELAPISAAFDARVEPCSLDRRHAVVDPAFAARLRTQHARRFEVAATKTDRGDDCFTRDVLLELEEILAGLGLSLGMRDT